MAKGTTADERREAVTYLPAGELPPPDDIDDAFEKWRESFDSAEEQGTLRAYQIPIDERGNVQPTAKNQPRLGSWPIDLYDFDQLCTMLIRDFMPAERVLAVRFLGIRPGHAGVQFNRIVVLRAPKYNPDTSAGPAPQSESLTTLMRAIQESNERTMAMLQSMRPAPVPDNSFEKILAMAQALNGPMLAMLGQIMPALAGRPAAGGDGGLGNLTAVIDLAGKIADMRGDGGNESTGNDLVDAIKAVVPLAKPALEAIPAILANRGPPVGGVPALTGPPQGAPRAPLPGGAAPPRPAVPPRAAPPGSVPTQPPAPLVGVTPTPNRGDIPSEDQEMLAQLMPQIDALVTMAERGSPALGAADLIFDQYILELPETPEDVLFERVAKLLKGPGLINQISVFNPKVLAHEAWFREVQAQLIKRYEDEEKAASGEQPTPV